MQYEHCYLQCPAELHDCFQREALRAASAAGRPTVKTVVPGPPVYRPPHAILDETVLGIPTSDEIDEIRVETKRDDDDNDILQCGLADIFLFKRAECPIS